MTDQTKIHSLPSFKLSRWLVYIDGYEEPGVFYATNSGSAKAQAWRSYPYDISYGDFMKIAKCRKDQKPNTLMGRVIDTTLGQAYYVGRNRQYVLISRDGESVTNIHPFDVVTPEYRPSAYRCDPVINTKPTLWQRVRAFFGSGTGRANV